MLKQLSRVFDRTIKSHKYYTKKLRLPFIYNVCKYLYLVENSGSNFHQISSNACLFFSYSTHIKYTGEMAFNIYDNWT